MHDYSVAVIIPAFNAAKYIKKTLDSVLCQNHAPLEIVVIDDGSTDETIELIENYSSRIKIRCHPSNANLGQSASLNVGIQNTKSDLIAFLDSDDIWYPKRLSEQVGVFSKYPNVGLAYTNGHVIDENDNILFNIFPDSFQERNTPIDILLKCYIRTESLVMVRRSIFERAGGLFRTDLQSSDHDMWIKMAEISDFCYTSKCLAAYRRHPAQISLKRRQWEDGFLILKEACKRYPYGNSVKRKRLAVLHYRLGEYDWSHNLYWRGITHFLLAAMFDPERSIEFVGSSLPRERKSN